MRKAGILMHISSLPSPYGIGTMGQAARDFVDFLHKGGQRCWQLLPIGHTSFGDSPYQSFSSYAGNPYFIDLDMLEQEGLLQSNEYSSRKWGSREDRVDYGALYQNRYPVLRLACDRLWMNRAEEVERFSRENREWLEDYALFMALKTRFGGAAWQNWPEGYRMRCQQQMEEARKELKDEIRFWEGVQFLFFQQWAALKEYANRKEISLIGDLPIYVAADSADVWASPDQFQLDEHCIPTEVAGCPPDAFTSDGQLWGNPLFNWDTMRNEGFRWWLRRIAFQFRLFDTLRIDHFRGFDAYYAIPYGDQTARNGHWKAGPGIDLFKTINWALGEKDIIAEDLGFLTDSVRQLLHETGYPGMKVLEFAFDSREKGSDYLPHCYTPHCVVYVGTHDNDTIMGWIKHAPEKDVQFAKEYLRLTKGEGYNWGMMRGAWASPADLAVMQMQDVLGLGSEARMNEPSTTGKNWGWRAKEKDFTDALAEKLRRDMIVYQRLH